LAYLVVTARPHSRARLCAMLWPVPDDPRAALRWSLTRLRPLVDEQNFTRIIADRDEVRFEPDHVTVDIVSIRNLVRNGTDSISTEALCEAATALEQDFLEGLDLPECHEFRNWCTAQREEMRRFRVRLLTALVARLEGLPDEAAPHARVLCALDPANETARAALGRLKRASGRPPDADEQFRSASKELDEFHVVASGALRGTAQPALHATSQVRVIDSPVGRGSDAEGQPARTPAHEVQFCRTSDGVRIAYASAGDGPPVVWATHWLSHLAFNWESPIWRHWTEEFAKDHTFVHFDHRGHGLSSWTGLDFSVDAFVRDLEAVVDALGPDQFALIGSSRAGSTAIAYAARHPTRVSRLVLHGAFAQGWRDWGSAAEIERREATITLLRQGWEQDNPAFRQILTTLLRPDATPEEIGWLNDLHRIAISADNVARVQQSSGDFNLLDLLPGIVAPTLVLHSRDDDAVPFEQSRLIASCIPGARFVTLEGRNHFVLPRDRAWAELVSEVRRFLRAEAPVMPHSSEVEITRGA
jgi:pimeloyl-ACP methyl ester carboxylesterase/DNA-binding SARP family transcriptional activator